MRPTFSIIFFTVVSGAGYGLLFLIGCSVAAGLSLASVDEWPMDGTHLLVEPRLGLLILLLCGALLATVGLIASLGHLGQPLRSWRAFSQWRSSWLSREGVAAFLTYLPIAAMTWILWSPDGPSTGAALRVGGALLALCSASTVICTAHIYSTLKPIRAWHNRFVAPSYLVFSLYSGALWQVALGYALPSTMRLPIAWYEFTLFANAIFAAPCCALLKCFYWRFLDSRSSESTIGSATGLARFGAVHSFERPHTEENYLTHEMGFALARKHARRLRVIAIWLILLAPLSSALLLTAIAHFTDFQVYVRLHCLAGWVALFAGMFGIFIERWLFFAEARHVVMLYYGAKRA